MEAALIIPADKWQTLMDRLESVESRMENFLKNPITIAHISVSQAMAELDCCRNTVTRLMNDKEIDYMRDGKKIMICMKSIIQYKNKYTII